MHERMAPRLEQGVHRDLDVTRTFRYERSFEDIKFPGGRNRNNSINLNENLRGGENNHKVVEIYLHHDKNNNHLKAVKFLLKRAISFKCLF